MSFQKGNTYGKLNGRPKGVKNKLTQTVKQIIDDNANDLLELAIKTCRENPEKNQALLSKLIDKFLPTLNKNENTNENITLYDETLERIIEKVKELNKPIESEVS